MSQRQYSVSDMTTEAVVGVHFAHEQQQPVAAAAPQSNPSRRWHWGRNARNKVNASYDSAATTRENYRHWNWADSNSADASMRPEIRRRIRSRARYEVLQNNPIGLGIVLTLTNDTIGTGPRLHLGLKNEKFNTRIQKAWGEWSKAVHLADKLHTMKTSKVIDGESVSRISVNPYLQTPITLDVQLLECDRLEAPYAADELQPNYIDGVHLDNYNNAVAYDILKHHPGSDFYYTSDLDFDTYDYRNIIHWFRPDRPEQHRGVSEVQSALGLFALLRRFTLATVSAAEMAANISLVMTSDMPSPDFGEEAESLMHDFWLDGVEIDRNAATVLPNGWNIQQIVAQHPSTTYAMFKHELIAEISRCLTMPYNIAAANSAEHNYASGRLDHQTYHQSITVERDRLNRLVLDRLFNEWMHEAALTGDVLPLSVANKVLETVDKYGASNISRAIPHNWHWDGFSHSDPVKEASATNIRLKNGTTHRGLEYAKEGRDIDVEDTLAAEALGMKLEDFRQMIAVQTYYNGNALSATVAESDDEPEIVQRSTTEETGGGSGGSAEKITNEPPQLRQANQQRRLAKQLLEDQGV